MALLTSSESTASSHLDLADKLTSQVANALVEKEKRKEIIRSRVSELALSRRCRPPSDELSQIADPLIRRPQYAGYYEDLISQRDAYFHDRAKVRLLLNDS